jgi:surface antigen
MKKLLITTFLLGSVILSGCEGHRRESGTIIGGVAGGLIGSQFGKGGGQVAATAIGAIAGAGLGNMIGSQMDERDQALRNRALSSSLETAPTGVVSTWKNPDSGNWGTLTPTKTFNQGNRFCREFTQKITIGGKTQEGYGTACRQPDGSWQIVSGE